MWLAAALLAGCTPEQEFQKQYPEAAVVPEVLDFGEVPVDYSVTGYATVTNSGLVALNLGELGLNDSEGVFAIGEHATQAERDVAIEIPVTFTPRQYTSYTSALTIPTDDPDNPTLLVTVTGVGVEAPTPDILVDPLALDFGTVPANGVGTLYFSIENEGDGTLVLDTLTQDGAGAFVVVGDVAGQSLAPGGSTLVVVNYLPTQDAGDHGSLRLASNDPDEPEVVITLVGNGGGDFEYPVAVIDAPATSNPRETITLDGTGSYDPNGLEPLTYEWSLVDAPRGADVAIQDPTNLDTAYLQADLAGTYTVELRVTNSVGLVGAPARADIEVIPQEALHVELTWNTGAADMDLHLVRGGGVLFQNPDDCNYCNPTPDWGTVAVMVDNPDHVLDDLGGYGPEEIIIDEPVDDTYAVRVHYFTQWGDGDVTATVNIWTYGSLELSTSRVMGYNDVWEVALVDFPSGLPYEESTDLYTTSVRTCY